MSLSRKPQENWLLSSPDTSVCKTRENKEIFPFNWLYLQINICEFQLILRDHNTIVKGQSQPSPIRGGTETNQERFADICNSRHSEIGKESRMYCQFDAFILYT